MADVTLVPQESHAKNVRSASVETYIPGARRRARSVQG